jgi:exodeoxyribonuclease VII large subunit
VVGEVQRAKPSPRGHFYFELVEKGARDEIVGKLDAVIWKSDYQAIQRRLGTSGQGLAEGVQIRCRGGLDFYPPGGRMQLTVKEVDPSFTLGLLERRRRETLAALSAAGMLERNRTLALPELPLTLALITSHGSAAYHDFLSGLAESGYGFRVLLVHASVQGREAEREVLSALDMLARSGVELAVLIRGGGSRSDLAVFDSRAIAEAIARSPFPVLTGLGHEIDTAIADLVAHTSFKTPTKVAEFLVERVVQWDRMLTDLRRQLARESLALLTREREALARTEKGLTLVRHQLDGTRERLERMARLVAQIGKSAVKREEGRVQMLTGRLGGAAPRLSLAAERRRVRVGERIAAAARSTFRAVTATLAGMERLTVQIAPERTLERGFSLTRLASGTLVRSPDQAEPGTQLVTQVAGGSFKSRVEAS